MHGPHSVIVAGPLAAVRFPNACARCAAPPAGELAIVKLFRRTYTDAPTRYIRDRVLAPFCRQCIAMHERDRAPVAPAVLRGLRTEWLLKSLPYLFPMALQLWFVATFAPDAVRGLLQGDLVETLVLGGVTLFFGLLSWWCLEQIRAAGRELVGGYQPDPNDSYAEVVRGPLGVTCLVVGPPTPTLAAVDYGDEVFEIFEPNRRSFHFVHPLVAEQFEALNAHLVWDPTSPGSRTAAGRRTLLYVVLGVATAALVLRDLLLAR
jgi:hypothetical protein